MTRRLVPRWCARDKAWLVPFGEVSEVTGRRKYLVLRDPSGQKVAGNDHVGKVRALQRLQEQQVWGPTVWEVISAYLRWHEERGSKPSTIAEHDFHLTKFGQFEYKGISYYDRPASAITLRDLSRVRESMEARGCQSGYIRHLYSSVLACWRWATRPIEGRDPERILEVNPFEGVERPRASVSRKRVIPWALIVRLRQFAWSRGAKVRGSKAAEAWRKIWMLDLIAESGCRPLEACTLQWDWVHERERYVCIPAGSHKTGHHRGKDRYFGLTAKMAEIFHAMRPDEPSEWPIWVFALKGRTRPPSRHGFDHWFADLRRAAMEAGLPIPPTMTLYSLRHSLVSQARQGGVAYRDLATHMGHSEQVAEQIYSHPDPSYVVAQFDRMHSVRQGLGSGS